MRKPVRRHHPRVTFQIVPSFLIEPGNGGMILNISREGLRFQAVAPVQGNGPVRFFFKEHNQQMAGCGELVWVDEAKKNGGLRFTDLSPEARGQVNEWIAHSASPPDSDGTSCAGSGSQSGPDEEAVSTDLTVIPPVVARPWAIKGSGFSTGFLAGLLISLLGASIILVGSSHRREVGESLIRLGQQLAPHSEVQTQNVLPPPQVAPTAALPTEVLRVVAPRVALPTKERGSSVSRKGSESDTLIRQQANLLRSADPEAQSVARAEETRRVEPKPEVIPTNRPPTAGLLNEQHSTVSAAPPVLLRAPASLLPKLTVNEASAVSQPVVSAASGAMNVSTVHMYFDLGKFKDEALAQQTRDRVARLGLRSTVLKKGFLWKSSYQVLVGPYSDEDEETRIEAELLSRGYKPRPFERGSRAFLFLSRVRLNGSRLPAATSFTISWESYLENANVTFVRAGDVIATARGKWIERPQKYSRDEYVYINGKKTLTEIHFAGLKRALVFEDSS